MHYVIQYLKHLLTARNQHGVHSPFVYDYLTKCLYAKPKFQGLKSENVLLKSIPYFSIKKFKVNSQDSRVENRILEQFELKASTEPPFDLIYMDNPEENIVSTYKDKIHNETLVFIKDIHTTKETTASWNALRQNQTVSVSIDLFHCGVLFFRKEQEKEHFKIRI